MKRMKAKVSPIWNYFIEVDANTAKCKICEKTYSRKGGTTTPLKSHLKSVHVVEYEEFSRLDNLKNTVQSSTASTSTPLQEAKKQLTLKDSLTKNQKWCTSNPKSQEIDKLIAEMIALQDLPFNFVEGIGFKRLMQHIAPNYLLRGRQFFTTYLCEDLYPKLAEKISKLLKMFDKISFTTDIWSEPSANVSLLSLTAHGIDEDFKRIKVILKCQTFDGRHTGDLIQDKFNEMLLEWGITYDKIHCFIRDAGSNMVRAMRLANIPDINCNVHQLQICVRNMLESDEDVKNLIAKCKRICTHFNHSQIAQSELQKIQQEQLNQQPLCLLQECATRWSSTFYMMERMIKIQDSLCLYAGKHNIPQISPEEWLQLKKIVSLLQPFEEITRNMSNSNTSISSVIPLIHTLKHTLQMENNKPDTNENFKNLIKSTIDQLNSRFGELHLNDNYSIATYLDPRYKTIFFNEVTKEKVESEIITLLGDAGESGDSNAAGSTSSPAAKRTRLLEVDEAATSTRDNIQSMLSDILMSSDDDDERTTANQNVVDNCLILKGLVNEYNREKRIAIHEDPLMWWRSHKKFQALYSIARQYLSCPPGSVASEQLFSGAGLIYDPLRNRLDGDKASKLLFVKYNLLLLEQLNLI